jgi:hypothetical protein
MIETQIKNTIDRLLISYTKIKLKKDTMQYKVLIFNKILTFDEMFKPIYFFVLLQQNQALMEFSPSKFTSFLFFKLPSAFWCGVRVKTLSEQQCVVTVKHRWFNQNPFKSMYFAVQAMAAELTTGALVIMKIKKSGKNISMLVANNTSNFSKKATGRITFTCKDGHLIDEAIVKTITTGEGQTFWMKSIGVNEKGEQVSELNFEWSIKLK